MAKLGNFAAGNAKKRLLNDHNANSMSKKFVLSAVGLTASSVIENGVRFVAADLVWLFIEASF